MEPNTPGRSPRFHRSYFRQWSVVAIVLLVGVVRWSLGEPTLDTHVGAYPLGELKPGVYEVERVVDGDTLLLKDRGLRVRLQGIDTPETVKPHAPVEAWGPEASEFTKSFLHEAGGRLRFEIDGEPKDQHGRSLAFAWRGEQLLNEELVRAGLARALLQYDYSGAKKDRLRSAQGEARRARRGIWSKQ